MKNMMHTKTTAVMAGGHHDDTTLSHANAGPMNLMPDKPEERFQKRLGDLHLCGVHAAIGVAH